MYIWSWKNKKFVLFTLKMKFLPNNLTKTYKFWIKTVVLYPKMYIWSRKKNWTFYSKNEVFAKIFHWNVQILDKKCSIVPKNVHLVPPKQKICTFYSKNEVFAKTFHWNVQILDKNCSFVPKNVHLVPKKQNICTFYSKNEVFAKKFH